MLWKAIGTRNIEFRSEDMLKLVPEDMLDVRFDYLWEGNGYRLEFTKP